MAIQKQVRLSWLSLLIDVAAVVFVTSSRVEDMDPIFPQVYLCKVSRLYSALGVLRKAVFTTHYFFFCWQAGGL